MSMQPVCRLGDMSIGACGHPPINAVSSNAVNVLVNGKPPIVVSSFWGFHCNGETCHPELAVSGNATVLVNGQPIVTQGTSLSGGDITGVGSVNVLA